VWLSSLPVHNVGCSFTPSSPVPGKAASVRPIAEWFVRCARAHAKFAVDLVDLKEVNLPQLDEPEHPRLQHYHRDYTRAWSATVQRADAYVFVTPEYNHGAPPALINALNYVFIEWNYKPAGFVSYGGISGGTRYVVMTKTILAGLKVVPILEAVNIPFVSKLMVDGVFQAGQAQESAAVTMLDELARWASALMVLRAWPTAALRSLAPIR
jgi:NAD(P)H-dependent FMN reductase